MNNNSFLTQWESAWDIVWTLSPEGTITAANEAIEAMTGWPASAWEGRSLLDLVHPDDVPVVARHLQSVMDGQLQPPFELRIPSSRGEDVLAEAAITRLPESTGSGGHRRLAVLARDITERQRTEELLREKDARFQELVEGTRAVPFEADCLQRRFTYVGPQAERLLGFAPETWCTGDFWMEHVHPADRHLITQFPASREDVAPDQEFVYRMIAGDERVVWLLHLAQRQPGGRLCRGFLIDVTERHEAQAELERSRAQHRALSERLQLAREEERLHVAREIHDELGQALTCIRMSALTVRTELQRTGEAAFLLARVMELEAMATETMRGVRRIATQLRPPILDRVGLFAAIEWQAADFEKRCGIRCRVERSNNEPLVGGDRGTAVFRIFQELLTNVGKHAGAKEIRVSLRIERRVLHLSVSDDGRGIEPADLAREGAFGVMGMRERAASFAGVLELTGNRRGTVVTLTMPLGPETTDSP